MLFECSEQNKFTNNYWRGFSNLHLCVRQWLKNHAVIIQIMVINKIKEQLRNNSGKNLFYPKYEDVLEINLSLIKELQRIKDSPNIELYEIDIENHINEIVNILVKEIYEINQFVNVSKQNLEVVKTIYRDTWASIKEKDSIEKVLYTEHYPKLSIWLSGIYPEEFHYPMRNQKLINKIVCKEYTPEFQLNIFGLLESEISEPFLDIGCGENANLVNYLREKSKEAFGFDRIIRLENKYLRRSDWFDYEYEKHKWGTIISNMALSNNFIYAANYKMELLDEYKKLYLRILDNLLLGGIFIYAPSFKKYEEELDLEKYKVTNIPVSKEFYLTKIEKIAL